MTTRLSGRFAEVHLDVPQGHETLDVAGFTNYGAGQAPDVVFLHANGFNARTYLSALEPLADSIAILVVDQRGHGGTPQNKSAEGRADALDLRDDLVALLDVVVPRKSVILAGHSLGGCVSLLAAATAADRVKALALFDPVVLSRESAERAIEKRGWIESEAPLADKARTRRRIFESRDAVFENYSTRAVFSTWPEAALRGYIESGFRDLTDGAVELACAPEWEASNFIAHGHDIWDAMSRITAPVRIFRAEHHSTCAVASSAEFPRPSGQVEVHTIPGTTHFLPIERPDIVCAAILEFATHNP